METMAKPVVWVDVRPAIIKSAVSYDSFDKALEALINENYEIISLARNAELRIQEGKDSSVSIGGNWTREGVLYIPNENPKLVRYPPALYSASQATQASKDTKEFYPTKEQIEQAVSESINFPTKNTKIPTNRFDSDPLTIFAFGYPNHKYGEFLRNAGIKKIPVFVVNKDYVNSQERPFIRQVWFKGLEYGSEIGSSHWARTIDYNRRLNDSNLLRGIKFVNN